MGQHESLRVSVSHRELLAATPFRPEGATGPKGTGETGEAGEEHAGPNAVGCPRPAPPAHQAGT